MSGVRQGDSMTVIDGTVGDGFEPVRETFAENFRTRNELGAACAVYHRGELVVDLWGGYRDITAETPWEEDTMVMVFSGTKGMTAAATAVAHSQGLFDLDDRIADHWPAFGRHGKSAVTVRQLLSHQAGLAAFDHRLSPNQIADRNYLSELLVEKHLDWEPGTRQGYHAFTLGWYVSELLRQIDGRTTGEFFAEEIAAPLDLEFYIGLPEDVPERRIAEPDVFRPLTLLRNLDKMPPRFVASFFNPWSITSRSLNSLDAKWMKDPLSFLSVEIPSANGIGTVRSIAEVYGTLATGGDRLGITDGTFEEMVSLPEPPSGGWRDVVIKVETAYSMGYSKPYGDFRFGTTSRSFGTPGAGGMFGFADPDAELGFAYAPNRLGVHLKDDPREQTLRDTVYHCLT